MPKFKFKQPNGRLSMNQVLIRVITLSKIDDIQFAFAQFFNDWRPLGVEPIIQMGSC